MAVAGIQYASVYDEQPVSSKSLLVRSRKVGNESNLQTVGTQIDEVEFANEDIYYAHRIVVANVVIEAFGK